MHCPKCAQDVTDTIAKTNQLQRGCIRLGKNIEDRDPAATGIEEDRSAAGTVNTITPKRKVRTDDHGCAAASAITLLQMKRHNLNLYVRVLGWRL